MEDKDKRIGWLRDLKEGDKVIISSDYITKIKSINKITPTGKIKIDNYSYDSDGREINGSMWHRKYLTQWTQEKEDEIIKQIKFQKICNKLSEVKWEKMEFDLVKKIYSILQDNKMV
jgi:hypothetical protein